MVLVIDNCPTGFVSLDVLEKRAEKISSVLVNILSQNNLDEDVRLVPGLTFNCSQPPVNTLRYNYGES